MNQATLDHFHKSQSVADIVRSIKTLHEYNIDSHGMFVLGADDDTRQTVRDTVSFALKHRIDTVMLNILTPLPGTPQFQQMEEQRRIFDKRWHLYDAHHVVFTPKQMTPYELQSEVLRGYMRFYSKRQWLKLARHLSLHEASLPRLGHVDHPRLAERRAQQGLRGGSQAITRPALMSYGQRYRHREHRSVDRSGPPSENPASRPRGPSSRPGTFTRWPVFLVGGRSARRQVHPTPAPPCR